jgi:hypothetical protein
VSVGTSIVPPGPCPPSADTPGTSPAVTTPQVTASIHDFAGSLGPQRIGIPSVLVAAPPTCETGHEQVTSLAEVPGLLRQRYQ